MNGWRRFIQIALPCLKFSPAIALSKDLIRLERELRVLEEGAKGRITSECKSLARKYFYYADWLMGEKDLSMSKDSLTYFFKHHNTTPSDNLKSIGDTRVKCLTSVVELVDEDSLQVRDVLDDEVFRAENRFKPGSVILENLNQLDKLVIMSENPEVHLLNTEKKDEVRDFLKSINFTIGPWIGLDSDYYVLHWNVLTHPLDEVKMKRVLGWA